MRARTLRRAAERKASKFAGPSAAPSQNRSIVLPPAGQRSVTTEADAQEAAELAEAFAAIPLPPSPARLAANRLNAQQSTGPITPEGRAISSQNHTVHGLARHNGDFRLLSSEDPAGFEALKQSLLSEHQPATETESILVQGMAESHWLAARAQRLQDTCIDPETGAVHDEKKFSLYLRYQTTHTRAFHKSLNDLLKLRAEKRKATLGFEAQRIQNEKHEMKKAAQNWELLRKDVNTHCELLEFTTQKLKARREIPGFEAQFDEELAQRGVEKAWPHTAAA